MLRWGINFKAPEPAGSSVFEQLKVERAATADSRGVVWPACESGRGLPQSKTLRAIVGRHVALLTPLKN